MARLPAYPARSLAALALLLFPMLARAEAGRVAYLAHDGRYWQVWTVAPDGRDPRQLTRSEYEKSRSSWYPDGTHLLVNALDGRLFRVNAETGEESPVEAALRGTVDAVLSPDGERIAFSLGTGGSRDANEIWTVKTDGGALRRLTTMPRLQHEPQWSPDGRWIYFLSGDGGQSHDVWRVTADASQREQLTSGSVYQFELAIASDGRLAYSSNRTGNYEIFTQHEAGPVERWTDHEALDGHPTWSPEGRALIFHSSRSGRLDLWRLEAAGAEPTRLTRAERGARNPVWWHPRQVQP